MTLIHCNPYSCLFGMAFCLWNTKRWLNLTWLCSNFCLHFLFILGDRYLIAQLWNEIEFFCQYFHHLQPLDDDHPCYYEILITILTFSLFTLELGHDEVWEVASSGFSDVNATALGRTYYSTPESLSVILDYDNNIWMIMVIKKADALS